jgi:creatinine amidohydrolase
VPVGSLEQHGPHLPLDTDTTIAAAVSLRCAELLGAEAVLVAPPLAFGSSGEHQSFPGTSSVGTAVLTSVLVELVRSMGTWADRVVLVNAHGGNLAALRSAVPQLLAEGHRVGWVPCASVQADAHAGLTETSVMLHLRPGDVRLGLAEKGNTASVAQLLPAMASGGVAAVSVNGVLGDPTGATEGHGVRVLAEMVGTIVATLRSGTPDVTGRLR